MGDNSAKQRRHTGKDTWKNLPPGIKLLETLKGDASHVNNIIWLPDGRIITSGVMGGSKWMPERTFDVWNAETGLRLFGLEFNKSECYIAFDPMWRAMASGTGNTIKLWKLPSGNLLRKWKGHAGSAIRSIAFDPTGHILASGSKDGTLRVWKYDDTIKHWAPMNTKNLILKSIRGHNTSINCIAFDPTGHILASGSDDKTIKLWEPTHCTLLHTLTGHDNSINCIAFSPTGHILASGSDDSTIKLWQLPSGKLIFTLEGHTGGVHQVAFSTDGSILVTKSADMTMRLWRSDTWTPIGLIKGMCLAAQL